MRHVMIMAGGSGTRLWPMSRNERPKQLLPLIRGESLLGLAYRRIADLVPPQRILICTGERFRSQVKAAIPQLKDEQILGEPVGRDSVNAIGLTAAILARRDPDAVFAALTSDHIISPHDRFRERLDLALRIVEEDRCDFATFSITPTYPATHFGWIERGDPIDEDRDVYECRRFVEKPDRSTAEKYVQTGRHGWNSGMFTFRASAFLDALRKYLPDAHRGLMKICDSWGGKSQRKVLQQVFPTLPKVSVDFAVMEPASRDDRVRIGLVTLDIEWMDVGNWPAYGETLDADAQGNRGNCPTIHLESANVLAVSDDPDHTIATIGCRDLVIVRTADATLVCPASEALRLKELAEKIPPKLR